MVKNGDGSRHGPKWEFGIMTLYKMEIKFHGMVKKGIGDHGMVK